MQAIVLKAFFTACFFVKVGKTTVGREFPGNVGEFFTKLSTASVGSCAGGLPLGVGHNPALFF
ncbi:MAG: hypothetical protein Q8S32_00675 [Burkholderiaceae bacterium]|nr:hypothetical protein [Burkholderiaceae bacterium]MDP3422257.1 hypothetical protein [Burkholderiaceae bacterium]